MLYFTLIFTTYTDASAIQIYILNSSLSYHILLPYAIYLTLHPYLCALLYLPII